LGARIKVRLIRPDSQACRRSSPGLDRLPRADIVGDQEIDPGQAKRLAERQELVGVEVNAGAEWRLKEVTVGGCRGVPAKVLR